MRSTMSEPVINEEGEDDPQQARQIDLHREAESQSDDLEIQNRWRCDDP